MRLKMFWMWSVAVFVAATVSGARAGQGDPEAAKLKNPVAATPETLAAGEALYKRRCSGCHGIDAKGGPPKEDFLKAAPNLVDDKADHGTSDGEVFTVIKNGVPPELVMDAWGERLSDTDIWGIVTYLKDQATKK
jgi:cytochrome c oxidase cbb3-type subunit 3